MMMMMMKMKKKKKKKKKKENLLSTRARATSWLSLIPSAPKIKRYLGAFGISK